MLSTEEIRQLADQYLNGTITPEDRARFDAWYNTLPDEVVWEEAGVDADMLRNSMYIDLLEKIIRSEPARVVPFRRKLIRYAAAVIILLMAGGAFWWFRDNHSPEETKLVKTQTQPAKDIQPGGNKATLTLADGSQLILDSMANGQLAQQGSAIVMKQHSVLDYSRKTITSSNTPVAYNTLTTPRGGKYQLVLPDGTMVWLNAASSLRFPAAFNGNTREVEVTGEAFFDVKKDNVKPFIVHAGEQQLQVLGTSFNINTYSDEEAPATTLITGSLRVSAETQKQSILLKPGQQAVLSRQQLLLRPCNTHDITAWKEDKFSYTETSIAVVMRQLARWYNLEVQYEGPVPVSTFSGTFPRDLTLSEVIHILKTSNVNLTLQNRTVTIHQ